MTRPPWDTPEWRREEQRRGRVVGIVLLALFAFHAWSSCHA